MCEESSPPSLCTHVIHTYDKSPSSLPCTFVEYVYQKKNIYIYKTYDRSDVIIIIQNRRILGGQISKGFIKGQKEIFLNS